MKKAESEERLLEIGLIESHELTLPPCGLSVGQVRHRIPDVSA